MRASRNALVVAALTLSGCATLFSGGPETVTFISNPEGAEVLIDGYPVGRTPLTVEIDRKSFGHRVITMRAPGYETRQFPLQKSLNLVALFNLGSLAFWATDATTGAMISYEPSSYYFELRPRGGPTPGYGGPSRYVYSNAESRALYFTLVNHRRLREQIARRGGEHLEALATLLAIPDERRPAFFARLGERSRALVTERYPHHMFQAIAALAEPRLPAR